MAFPVTHMILTSTAGLSEAQPDHDIRSRYDQESGLLLPSPIATVRRWQMNARTRAALSDLDQHQLSDVGITNDQQRREVAKWFWE